MEKSYQHSLQQLFKRLSNIYNKVLAYYKNIY